MLFPFRPIVKRRDPQGARGETTLGADATKRLVLPGDPLILRFRTDDPWKKPHGRLAMRGRRQTRPAMVSVAGISRAPLPAWSRQPQAARVTEHRFNVQVRGSQGPTDAEAVARELRRRG
jgi:hypothetical protein